MHTWWHQGHLSTHMHIHLLTRPLHLGAAGLWPVAPVASQLKHTLWFLYLPSHLQFSNCQLEPRRTALMWVEEVIGCRLGRVCFTRYLLVTHNSDKCPVYVGLSTAGRTFALFKTLFVFNIFSLARICLTCWNLFLFYQIYCKYLCWWSTRTGLQITRHFLFPTVSIYNKIIF